MRSLRQSRPGSFDIGYASPEGCGTDADRRPDRTFQAPDNARQGWGGQPAEAIRRRSQLAAIRARCRSPGGSRDSARSSKLLTVSKSEVSTMIPIRLTRTSEDDNLILAIF